MEVENKRGVILLNLKKYFVGASTMLIIFANNPQIFAEESEIFGAEFDSGQSQPDEVFTPPEEVVIPPQEEIVTPPQEEVVTPPQEEVVTPPQEEVVTPPQEEVVTPPQEEVITPPQEEVVTPPQEEVVTPPQEEVVTPPQEEVVTPPQEEIVTPPQEEVVIPPQEEVVTPPQEEVSAPFEQNGNDDDFGDSLNFNDINSTNSPETFTPPEQDNNPRGGTITVRTPPENNSPRTNSETQTPSTPQKKLKVLPQRFVQVAVDENYIYFLDKQSVSWKKIPYMNSEYMADVWVRMIERNSDTSDMPADLAAYVSDTNSDEIELAKAKGYQYLPDDVKVLRHKKYFLERYYLRPKTEQVQFICELEVVGHPQNTASQRKYNYANWEELIPGSIESILYYSIIQVIGKSKASERGHMTFADMVEEYGRISIR